MRPEDRERIQVEVASRVVDRHVGRAAKQGTEGLEAIVNDTLYHERRRLERESGNNPRYKADQAFYAGLQKRRRNASEAELHAIIQEMARYFVGEVVGNFDERIYRLSTTAVPIGLSVLLNAMSPGRLFNLGTMTTGIAEHVEVRGEVEHARRLLDNGTLIVVPTHSSNLDSIVLGYAAHQMGLPPLLYGAGLNLFTNPMISFFMRNLGAYRVDRRKTAALYKDTLKEYATCSLEYGYHNLFFPGGTRSRSGSIERKLKKGLLGTGVPAYVGNLRSRNPKPNLYVAPCTLSYKLVLEAETLIRDHLAEIGKSRFIIEDDEFAKPREIYKFLSRLISLDARIIVTLSAPLDIFGNRVDAAGASLDPRGRPVDITRYVCRDGEPVYDRQRDMQYTAELAEGIGASYLRDNVLMSTNIVGFAIFELIKRANPDVDLYRLIQTGGRAPSFSLAEVHAETEHLVTTLRALPAPPHLGDEVAGGDIQAIVGDALKHFALYHSRPAAFRRGDRVFHDQRTLLLYYGNRLRGYDLGRRLAN